MTNKYIVNPDYIYKCDFKRLFSYKLIYYIMNNYDTKTYIIKLKKHNIIQKFNSNYHTINDAINELVDNKIIVNLNYDNKYRVNKKILVEVLNNNFADRI